MIFRKYILNCNTLVIEYVSICIFSYFIKIGFVKVLFKAAFFQRGARRVGGLASQWGGGGIQLFISGAPPLVQNPMHMCATPLLNRPKALGSTLYKEQQQSLSTQAEQLRGYLAHNAKTCFGSFSVKM